jgi:hypothetical protein
MFRTNSKRRPNKSMRKSRKSRKGGDDIAGGLKRRKSRKSKVGGDMTAYDKQDYLSKSLPLNLRNYRIAIQRKNNNKIDLAVFDNIEKDFMEKWNKAANDYDTAIKNGIQPEIKPEIPPVIQAEIIRPIKLKYDPQLESILASEPKPWWNPF